MPIQVALPIVLRLLLKYASFTPEETIAKFASLSIETRQAFGVHDEALSHIVFPEDKCPPSWEVEIQRCSMGKCLSQREVRMHQIEDYFSHQLTRSKCDLSNQQFTQSILHGARRVLARCDETKGREVSCVYRCPAAHAVQRFGTLQWFLEQGGFPTAKLFFWQLASLLGESRLECLSDGQIENSNVAKVHREAERRFPTSFAEQMNWTITVGNWLIKCLGENVLVPQTKEHSFMQIVMKGAMFPTEEEMKREKEWQLRTQETMEQQIENGEEL